MPLTAAPTSRCEERSVMDERHAAMTRAYELAADFLDTLHDRPVWPRATYQEMLEALGGELPAAGLDPVDVVGDLARLADPGIAGTAGGRFFGFVIGGELPAALGADWLTSVWDQKCRAQLPGTCCGGGRDRRRRLDRRHPRPAARHG